MTETGRVYTAYESMVGDQGTLTLPVEALAQLGIQPGDFVTVIAAEGGLLLVPTRLVVLEVAQRIEQLLANDGLIVGDLLAGLDDEGSKLFQAQYGHLL